MGAIGQRHPPSEVCDAIIEICRLRAWRAGWPGWTCVPTLACC